ncbi:MAG: hypothetical protein KGL39_47180 [Patescibacteria group bacterium]|nr:hypothetical protein [Patescibacteria group bacterium]
MIHRIEITFDLPVELSDEEMRALDKVVGHICDRECPEGWAFWPAGFGSKPSFSQADAAFLGKPIDPSAPATGEPTWDDDVLQIDCSARPLAPSEIEKREFRKAHRTKRQRRLSYRVKRAYSRIKSAITEF